MLWAQWLTDLIYQQTMQLTPWQYTAPEHFTIRGWHSTPSGKPLLHFLHGNGFCGRMYEPMLQKLAIDFDLWLCDVQGHGDSDQGGRFLGWNGNAALAMAAFDQQNGAFKDVPHYALGHSFGGVLTSLTLGETPTRFARAVLLDPVLFTPTMLMGMSMASMTGMLKHAPMATQARGRRHQWASRDEAYDLLHGRGVYKGWADEALRAFVNHALKDDPQGGVSLKCTPSLEADVFGTMPDRLWSLLDKVRTPTMVLHGKKTFPFVGESARSWQRDNKVIDQQQVEGGHCFMQENPAQAADHVRDFLLR